MRKPVCLLFLYIVFLTGPVGAQAPRPMGTEEIVCGIVEIAPGEGKTRTVTLDRGKEDGLIAGWKGTLYSRWAKIGDREREYKEIGTAEILRVEARTAVARITMSKPSGDGLARVGDMVEVRARTPKQDERSLLWRMATLHIELTDLDKKPFATYPALYAGETAALVQAAREAMRTDMHTAGRLYGNRLSPEPRKTGRYVGKTLQQVLESATQDDLTAYFQYVCSFPAKYIGPPLRLAESFAGWVTGDAPASTLEIGDRLIAAKTAEARAAILRQYAKEIIDHSMIEHWYSRAQDLAKERKFEPAHALADAAIQACDLLQQPKYRGWTLFAKAFVYAEQPDHRAAVETYGRAMAIFRAVKPPTDDSKKGMAFSLNNRGGALKGLGRLKEALDSQEAALKIKEATPSLGLGTQALNRSAIGETYYAMGAYAQAIAWVDRAAALLKQLGDTPAYCAALNWKASAYTRMGKTQEAARAYGEALAIQKREDDRDGQAQTLIKLGDHHWRAGRYKDALQDYQEAARLREEMGDRKGLTEAQNGIGRLAWNLGDYAASMEAHTRALTVSRAIQNRPGEARALKELGDLAEKTGDRPKALALYRESRDLYHKLGDRLGEASAMEQTGHGLLAQNDPRGALQWFTEAAELYRQAGDKANHARTLYNRGVSYERLNDLPAARRQFLESLAVYQAIGAKADAVDSQVALGNLAWRQRDLEGALKQFQAAQRLAKEVGSRSLTALVVGKLGRLSLNRYRPQEARRYLEQALAIYRDPVVRDRSEEAETLRALSDALASQAQYREALERSREALRIAEETKARPLAGLALRQQGWIYRALGQAEEARDCLKKSLAVAEEAQDAIAIADATYALAALASDFGDARLALEYGQRALETYRAKAHESGLMTTENAIGVYYYRQGDLDEAKARFERARALAEKMGAKTDIVIAAENLGEVYLRRGAFDRATRSLQRALQVCRTIGEPDRLAALSVTVARCYRERAESLRKQGQAARAAGDFVSAEAQAGPALATLRKVGVPGGIVDATMEMCLLHTARRRFKEAEPFGAEAVRIAEKIKSRHQLWEAYDALSRCYEAQGDLGRAAAMRRKAIQVVEALRQGVAGGDRGMEKFLHSRVKLYESMAELLGRLGAKEKDAAVRKRLAEEALGYISLARFEVLKERAASVRETGDQKLDRASEAYRAVVLRQGQMEREKAEAAEAGNTEKVKALEAVLARDEEELVSRYVQLAEADPDFAARMNARDPRRINESVGALPEKTCLLVCFPGQEGLHLWVFDRGGIRVWRRAPQTRKDLYALVQQFRAGIDQMKGRVSRREPLGEGFGAAAEADTKNPDWYRENIRAMRGTLTSLYAALIAPVEKEIADAETVLILPYGQLCYLPFEALTPPGGAFFGQTKRVVYFTSEAHLQSVLREMKSPVERAADCWVAFADPRGRLGSAMEEAQEIAALFPTSEVHSQKTGDATKDSVYKLRPDCTILHFATHGWLNSANPNQTFLEMGLPAGGPQTMEMPIEGGTVKIEMDGSLTQLEVYPRLRKIVQSFKKRQVRLVTLSACETARAQEAPEAEVLGMPDAFTMAGAAAVLASQWAVETYSTTDLMVAFYRLHAQEKRSKGEALMQAKQMLMTQNAGLTAHPFYWAPFVLFGDWR